MSDESQEHLLLETGRLVGDAGVMADSERTSTYGECFGILLDYHRIRRRSFFPNSLTLFSHPLHFMAFTDLFKNSYVKILELDRSIYFCDLGCAPRWPLAE